MERANYSDIPDLGTESVLIRVGQHDHQTDFLVHKHIICKSSDVMKTKLNEPWNEATGRIIHVPSNDPNTFSIYYQWLLTSKLHTKERGYEVGYLVYACLLGHELRDSDFIDTVHDGILQYSTEKHDNTLTKLIMAGSILYLELPGNCHTKDLFIDLVAWLLHGEETTMSNMRDLFKSAFGGHEMTGDLKFVEAVFKVVASMCMSRDPMPSPRDGWQSSCKYHCHGEEKACFRTKSKKPMQVPKRSEASLSRKSSQRPSKTQSQSLMGPEGSTNPESEISKGQSRRFSVTKPMTTSGYLWATYGRTMRTPAKRPFDDLTTLLHLTRNSTEATSDQLPNPIITPKSAHGLTKPSHSCYLVPSPEALPDSLPIIDG